MAEVSFSYTIFRAQGKTKKQAPVVGEGLEILRLGQQGHRCPGGPSFRKRCGPHAPSSSGNKAEAAQEWKPGEGTMGASR